ANSSSAAAAVVIVPAEVIVRDGGAVDPVARKNLPDINKTRMTTVTLTLVFTMFIPFMSTSVLGTTEEKMTTNAVDETDVLDTLITTTQENIEYRRTDDGSAREGRNNDVTTEVNTATPAPETTSDSPETTTESPFATLGMKKHYEKWMERIMQSDYAKNNGSHVPVKDDDDGGGSVNKQARVLTQLIYPEGRKMVPKPLNINHDCFCGHYNSRTPKIVGGSETHEHHYPWMVSLQLSKNKKHFCGASIISDTFFLTAAHCTDGYNDKTTDSDISLLSIAKPLIMTWRVRPICLTPPGLTFYKERVSVMGWGKEDEDAKAGSPRLRHTQLTILPLLLSLREQITVVLLRPRHQEQINTLVSTARKTQSVYTKAANYLDWIYETTSRSTYCSSYDPQPDRRKIKESGQRHKLLGKDDLASGTKNSLQEEDNNVIKKTLKKKNKRKRRKKYKKNRNKTGKTKGSGRRQGKYLKYLKRKKNNPGRKNKEGKKVIKGRKEGTKKMTETDKTKAEWKKGKKTMQELIDRKRANNVWKTRNKDTLYDGKD
ncbi:Transmembrane protease serine 7-like, partial [Homarus americanus]